MPSKVKAVNRIRNYLGLWTEKRERPEPRDAERLAYESLLDRLAGGDATEMDRLARHSPRG